MSTGVGIVQGHNELAFFILHFLIQGSGPQDENFLAFPLLQYTEQQRSGMFTCCPNGADTVRESKHQDIQENPGIRCLRLKVYIRECQGAPGEGEKIPSR